MSRVVALALVVGALFASAVASVFVQHERRALFVELRQLERERDALGVHWGRLLLERSAWATHERIERIAREELELHRPPASALVLVRP